MRAAASGAGDDPAATVAAAALSPQAAPEETEAEGGLESGGRRGLGHRVSAPGSSGRPEPRCRVSTWWQQRSIEQAGDSGGRCFFKALEICC